MVTCSGAVRVLIVDEHEIVRDVVGRTLGRQTGLEVVGKTGDAAVVLELVGALRPDVVLMDVRSCEECAFDGVEMTRRILERSPGTNVIAFSGESDRNLLQRFLAAGGAGFVGKTAKISDLVDAIGEAAAGRTPIVGSFTRPRPEPEPHHASTVEEHFSGRELQVLELVARGFSSKEVGAALDICPTTVDTYRRRIGTKLGSRDRSTLVRYAIDHGLLG